MQDTDNRHCSGAVCTHADALRSCVSLPIRRNEDGKKVRNPRPPPLWAPCLRDVMVALRYPPSPLRKHADFFFLQAQQVR